MLRGTLRRHAQSMEAFAQGYGAGPAALPAHLDWPGLNEYDSEALIRSVHPGPLAKPDSPEVYRAHFRLLREGMAAWMAGRMRQHRFCLIAAHAVQETCTDCYQ